MSTKVDNLSLSPFLSDFSGKMGANFKNGQRCSLLCEMGMKSFLSD